MQPRMGTGAWCSVDSPRGTQTFPGPPMICDLGIHVFHPLNSLQGFLAFLKVVDSLRPANGCCSLFSDNALWPKATWESEGFTCLLLPGHGPSLSDVMKGTHQGLEAETLEDGCSDLLIVLCLTDLVQPRTSWLAKRIAHHGLSPPLLVNKQGNLP